MEVSIQVQDQLLNVLGSEARQGVLLGSMIKSLP